MGEPIIFAASFPAIQSAIKISGDGNGLRLQLDVPEIDVLNALHVIAMRQRAFRVTIEPLDEVLKDERTSTAFGRTKAKRRV